jgi:N-acetyl-gamma-glutamyl-phosphate reductase
MLKVGIIGASGYAGAELLRLLQTHPNAKVVAISSHSFEGKNITELYPNFNSVYSEILCDADEVVEKSELIFAALPHGLSEPLGKKCLELGKKLIDLGADFRLSEDDYKEWYGLTYSEPELHKKSVYCIPELHRGKIKNQSILGNPGCYVTSASLALAPILSAKAADLNSIIIDSKSGATGAGRGLALNTHYTECNEAFAPYKIASHRHTPEIEQNLSEIAGEKVVLTFVPHLLAVNRGIISTCYVTLKERLSEEKIRKIYEDFYKGEQFIRLLEPGKIANLKYVKYSNYCDISLHLDKRCNRLIVVSAIDNMVKGAAGQAIQNMNLMYGFDETAGLMMIPPAF